MDPKENLLRAIYLKNPSYVPRPDEGVMLSVDLGGNFRRANWTDHWGVGWRITLEDFVPFPKVNPLPDLAKLGDFAFPDPADLTVTQELEATLRSSDRDRHLIMGRLIYLLFERAWALMGMEAFLIGFYTHPDEMRALLRGIADYNIQVFDRYLEMGVDGITFSEDLGSQKALLMSPSLFREFILPEYKRCFQHVLDAGKIVQFHSCGCVQDIAADLAAIGVTILNPVQARANDLARLKQIAVEGKMALQGGIDSHLLVTGTPADVARETHRVIKILGPGGGYLLAPDQGMPWPQANYDAMIQAARDYGSYPISGAC